MEKPLTKKEVIDWFTTFQSKDFFCPFCCGKLQKTKEDKLYCPNEMCLNEENY